MRNSRRVSKTASTASPSPRSSSSSSFSRDPSPHSPTVRRRARRSSVPPSEPSSDDEFEFENEEENEAEGDERPQDKKNDSFKWTTEQPSFVTTLCTREERVHGMAVNCAHPLALLQLFLTRQMMCSFVHYTNSYAEFVFSQAGRFHTEEHNNEYEDIQEDQDDSEDSSSEVEQQQQRRRKFVFSEHMKGWEPTTEKELWVFFAIQVVMGISRLPCTALY